MSTALLDVTSDINVALWFATHDWNSGSPSREGVKRVVYRFDTQRLDHCCAEYNAIAKEAAIATGIAPPPPCFLITLDDIPQSFACRPARQSGGSIYGLDQLSLIDLLVRGEALQIFEFLIDLEMPEVGGLTSSFLAPADDPFLELVEEFKSSHPGL